MRNIHNLDIESILLMFRISNVIKILPNLHSTLKYQLRE